MTYKMDELYERIEALSPLQSTLFKLRLEQEGVDFYSELETAPAVERLPLIERTEKKDHYTLAPVQKRLFLLSNMESGGTLYNLPLVMLLKFEPDLRRLNEVFETVIRRHEAFRTSFHWLEEEAVMRVHGNVDFQLQCLELQREPVLQVVTDVDENAVHQINETLANFSRPFDLAVPPLLRVGLMKVIPGCCFLAVDMHHMVSDMMSLRLFKKELLRLYEGDAPEPLSLQYKDYACWRNSKQVNRTIKRQERYWLNMFSGDIPCADLPTDYERPQSRNFSGDSVSFEIGPKETAALKAMALEKKTSLFVVMLAAYNILLSKITDGEDIVVGIPVVGRGQPGLEKIIGMFVNTLALRNVPQADKTFGDFLSEVRQGSLDAFKNQDYLFDDLVSKVVKERDNSRNPLFDVFFAFANPDFPIAAQQDLLENDATEAAEITGTTNTTNTTNSTNSTETRKTTGLEEKFKNRSGGSGLSMFDLFLHGTETTTGSPGDSKNNAVLRLAITYSTVLFKEDTIKRFSGYFKDIVATAAGDVNIKLRDITLSHELGTAGAAALEEMDDNFGF